MSVCVLGRGRLLCVGPRETYFREDTDGILLLVHLCGVEVEDPQQSSSFKDDEFVSIVFSADVARTLGHEVVLLVQLHHGTVKVT